MKIDLVPEDKKDSISIYMKNTFPYNAFIMLQDLTSDKTWMVYSYNNSNHIKIIQLKS